MSKFNRIVLFTDELYGSQDDSLAIRLTGLGKQFSSLQNLNDFRLHELILDHNALFIMAYKSCSPEIRKFMIENAEKKNFLTFLPRPGSGVVSQEAETFFGKIKLVNHSSIYQHAFTEAKKLLTD